MKKEKKKIRFLVSSLTISILIIIALLAIIFLFLFKTPQAISQTYTSQAYHTSLAGYEKVDVSIAPPNTVILTSASGCLRIIASTTRERAESIYDALQKKEGPRPNAHDLTKYILEEYNINLIAVKIEEMKDNTFYSKLVLQQGNKVLNLDSRPSDAMAIALRLNKPIYIKKTLLADYGENIC
ncbi:hypothetical protein B6U80_00455 [Candidatus Pacearchaeota archaeon ex4484_26]|nr:MAG: hypothetical protein B6U80_00455 [Candidatus Pacearchaeota archaeon ex4484_26]